jgi:hypothetical protein
MDLIIWKFIPKINIVFKNMIAWLKIIMLIFKKNFNLPNVQAWLVKCIHFIITKPSYLKLYNGYYYYHQIWGHLVVCWVTIDDKEQFMDLFVRFIGNLKSYSKVGVYIIICLVPWVVQSWIFLSRWYRPYYYLV